ncbi:MAG: 3-deoxy-D-manno-octulosonic acid transferase [Ferruginibacter sp.]
MLGKSLYNLFLFLYSCGIRVAAIANPKARKWLQGRRDIFERISRQLTMNNLQGPGGGQPIWMHCASLGEFEQGRPLLEALKSQNPNIRIVLSFFSPSGYEVMKEYKAVDHIFYLPMDSPVNAKKFLDAVNPSLVLWVKYEYWYYYLTEIKKRNIPALLVSGIFRQNQPFFAWYGAIWREMLKSFTYFFVQNTGSRQLLSALGFTENVSITGDTRFDRVMEIADHFTAVPGIAEFCGSSQVIVAGSTWEEDEIELLHFVNVNRQVKFIIAPHEIDKANLKDVKEEFPNSLFYSELNKEQYANADARHSLPHVLIIDNIGMLSRLYNYATIAYVGGGYGVDGVHNVLEAAVYGKPVVFGPVYEKFDEATGLLHAGGAVCIDGGPVKLEHILNNLLQDERERNKTGAAARQFVYTNAGASKKIIQFIQEKRLLTS